MCTESSLSSVPSEMPQWEQAIPCKHPFLKLDMSHSWHHPGAVYCLCENPRAKQDNHGVPAQPGLTSQNSLLLILSYICHETAAAQRIQEVQSEKRSILPRLVLCHESFEKLSIPTEKLSSSHYQLWVWNPCWICRICVQGPPDALDWWGLESSVLSPFSCRHRSQSSASSSRGWPPCSQPSSPLLDSLKRHL